MISPQTTKKDLNDLIWLSEHPEHEHRVVGIREFIDSPDYLNAKNECWPNIKDDLEDLDNSGCTEAVLCYAIGGGKSFASSILIVHRAYKVLYRYTLLFVPRTILISLFRTHLLKTLEDLLRGNIYLCKQFGTDMDLYL